MHAVLSAPLISTLDFSSFECKYYLYFWVASRYIVSSNTQHDAYEEDTHDVYDITMHLVAQDENMHDTHVPNGDVSKHNFVDSFILFSS